MKKIAIIPARGGSKRIPRKNIKEFLGKPIIAYSVETALQSGLFDEVMVSTDDEEIAEVAKRYGANVPFMRSRVNAGDFATTVDVLQEVLAQYLENEGRNFDYGCCLYPTAPLIKIEHLKKGFNKLKKNKCSSVFPVIPFSYPIWRGLEIDSGEKVKMVWPQFLNSRSQDLKVVYHDVGQWYWFKINKTSFDLLDKDTSVVEISELECQDIDNPTDWKIAELKFKLNIETNGK